MISAPHVNKDRGSQALTAPAANDRPLVGVAAWAAVAAAAPAVPTRRAPVLTPMMKSASPNLENIPIGRNLVNQGGAATGVNSSAVAAMPGNVQLALRILGSRNITKIRCHICKQDKNLDNYSNRQLINYKDSIYNEYAPGGRCKTKTASCKDCVNGVVTHLDCHVCGLTKPLSKFMKTQRRIPDRARCKRCVQLHLDTERAGEVEDLDDYDSDDSEEDDSDEDVDLPPGTEKYANGSTTCPVEADDEDVDGGMAKVVGQMNIGATPTPSTTASSITAPTTNLCSARGESSASIEGSTTPASSFEFGESASVAGTAATATHMSAEWEFVNAAGKGKNYGNGKSDMGCSSPTVGAPGYMTPGTVGTIGGTTSTAGRKVGGWVKEKIKPPLENAWGVCAGGQPRLFKKKQGGRKNNEYGDDLGEDDGEEI